MSKSLVFSEQIAHSLFCSQKTSDLLSKIWLKLYILIPFLKKTSNLLIPSFLMSNVSKSLRLLTKNEWCERIAQVDHQKWVTMSELLTKMIKWVNRSFLEQIAHLLIILQKTSNSLRKPMSKFPTQEKSQHHTQTIIASGQALILADHSQTTAEESASHTDHHRLMTSITIRRITHSQLEKS